MGAALPVFAKNGAGRRFPQREFHAGIFFHLAQEKLAPSFLVSQPGLGREAVRARFWHQTQRAQ